eukprot:COSAG05_NODE_20973_length_275_cov_0.875000_1_plen_36_part_10
MCDVCPVWRLCSLTSLCIVDLLGEAVQINAQLTFVL